MAVGRYSLSFVKCIFRTGQPHHNGHRKTCGVMTEKSSRNRLTPLRVDVNRRRVKLIVELPESWTELIENALILHVLFDFYDVVQ